ncbi:MAG: multicopper oxidase domain-containing protein [Gemmatimonadales bacterium]|jgi:hypothetical protein
MSRKAILILVAIAILAVAPASAKVRHLYVAATDGYAYVPDHNGYADAGNPGSQMPVRRYYIRGFCDDTPDRTAEPGCANLPAPIIDVDQGDDVFLHLRNIGDGNPFAPKDPHTIHLHGMHVTTQNDGFNETSFEVPEGTEAVYYFNPDKPGTYMWHCHVEASEHVQMGMYGLRRHVQRPLRPRIRDATVGRRHRRPRLHPGRFLRRGRERPWL